MSIFSVEELLEVENSGWRSLCESRGGTFYGQLMTPGAVFILVNGTVMDRDAVASSLDGMPGWDSYEITDAGVVEVGDDAAALVYRVSASRADLAEPFDALMTSVYRGVGGQLRLTLYQQTTITH